VYTFLADVRYGGRVLLRSPGFTFVAVAALAIGIGANLTIFGFAKELLLSPPAGIADPDRVVLSGLLAACTTDPGVVATQAQAGTAATSTPSTTSPPTTELVPGTQPPSDTRPPDAFLALRTHPTSRQGMRIRKCRTEHFYKHFNVAMMDGGMCASFPLERKDGR